MVVPKGDGKKHPDVSCPHRNKIFRSAQVGKHLKVHIRSCSFSADIKQRYALSSPPSTPKRKKKRRSLGTPRSPSKARKTPPKSQRLHEYGQAELELDLAMEFYATEISFRVIEDPKMKLLFKHLRPDFKLSSRYKLAGPSSTSPTLEKSIMLSMQSRMSRT
ncbi:hypothetical protein F441_16358 [Phytophthora nicotianae CJ01A1]|uniref:Uncharacterized protein n=2 Tax=Phytophthora nicotianae TaxID=4792 RepID=W2PSK6_PHYN3|nr:hypothetical protein PPTG_16149 [Phytophthora nicotianae INRA-310]ETN03199.1 hypothetical protein PPTG_16149 [Phytophthora nicotianae INRA-310]ETP07310.1 hypothetical protein F441_16358 [Phytophthora nicotianae CJ01A1]